MKILKLTIKLYSNLWADMNMDKINKQISRYTDWRIISAEKQIIDAQTVESQIK